MMMPARRLNSSPSEAAHKFSHYSFSRSSCCWFYIRLNTVLTNTWQVGASILWAWSYDQAGQKGTYLLSEFIRNSSFRLAIACSRGLIFFTLRCEEFRNYLSQLQIRLIGGHSGDIAGVKLSCCPDTI